MYVFWPIKWSVSERLTCASAKHATAAVCMHVLYYRPLKSAIFCVVAQSLMLQINHIECVINNNTNL
jgi:hypothetical protein